MKPLQLRDVRELLASQAFASWYRHYSELRSELESSRRERGELLQQVDLAAYRAEATGQLADNKVFEAGELGDMASAAHARFASIENESFQSLSAFEEQRARATQAWAQHGSVENQLEEARQRHSELSVRRAAAIKVGSDVATAEAARLGARIQEVQTDIPRLNQAVEEARTALHAESGRREELWAEVEVAWGAAFRANVERAEYRYQAKRIQAESEELTRRAAHERGRIEVYRNHVQAVEVRLEEQQRRFDAHLKHGAQQFECTLVRDFLYWPMANDVRFSICLALIDEPLHFNIQVVALQIYQVERARGVDFIEPLADDIEVGVDPRLESFFVDGRPVSERAVNDRTAGAG